MSDAQDIQELLNDQQFNEALHSYVDSQFEFLNDIKRGVYSSGQVTFDTLALRDKWVDYHHSYLAIPINISSATPIIDADVITVKRAVTDFIYGMTVSTGSGATIVADNNIVTINHIRLLVEMSFERWQEEAAQLIFSKDRKAVPVTNAFGDSTPPISADVDATTMSTTAFVFGRNQGLVDRAAWFKQACVLDAGVIKTVVFIPLKYLHDMWMQLDFPLINLRLQMSFLLNMYSNGGIIPPIGGRRVANAGTTTGTVGVTVTVGTATIPGSNAQLTNCRLYYKTVKYHPEVQMQLAQKLAAGFTKYVDFRLADTYLPTTDETNKGAGHSITKFVSPSTIRPLRVWLLAPPTGALNSSAPVSTTTTTTNSGLMPLAQYVGGFTNANCLVNNSRYYNNDLVTAQDFYNILREQFPDAQGLLSYSDFLLNYRLHCFDLTRLKDRLKNPNEACSIQINATRSDANACDYYFIVERLQRISLHMSSAESSVVVGLVQQ